MRPVTAPRVATLGSTRMSIAVLILAVLVWTVLDRPLAALGILVAAVLLAVLVDRKLIGR